MNQYRTKFVVYNQVPEDTHSADLLSSDINMSLGSSGWQLVSSLIIPTNGTPGLLLVFQREIQAN
jgi:hypothetical protein